MIHILLHKIVSVTLDDIELFARSRPLANFWTGMILLVAIPASAILFNIKAALFLSTLLLLILYPVFKEPILLSTNTLNYNVLSKWISQYYPPISEALPKKIFRQANEDTNEDAASFRCGLSLAIPDYPLKIGNQLYDLSYIKRWVDDNHSNPLTREPLSAQDLLHAMIDPETGEDKFGINREELIKNIVAYYKP